MAHRRARRQAPVRHKAALELSRHHALATVIPACLRALDMRANLQSKAISSRAMRWRPAVWVCSAGGLHLRGTCASFQPRLKVSCIDTFMPWPALALWVWQASPAMKTRDRQGIHDPPGLIGRFSVQDASQAAAHHAAGPIAAHPTTGLDRLHPALMRLIEPLDAHGDHMGVLGRIRHIDSPATLRW